MGTVNFGKIFDFYFRHTDLIAVIALVIGISVIGFVKTSDYATKSKKKKVHFLRISASKKAHGIIFGKKGSKVVFSPEHFEGHVGVFSATGTGKTAAVGIPTLRSWTDTSFVIDISGDIEANCPNIKNKLVFDVEDPDTPLYNIFEAIDKLKDPDDRNEALAELVHLIAPDIPDLAGSAKFFYEGGQDILTAAFIAFYNQGLDFIPICRKINDSNWKDLFTAIDDVGIEAASSHLSNFDPDRPTDNAGCMQDAKKAIKFFVSNHNVARSIGRPNKNKPYVAPRMIEKSSIFIKIEDEKLELYSPLLNLIVSQQMQYISSRKINDKSKPILVFLDEYASLRIDKDIILAALRKYRKKRCRILLCTQNLADLDILYGHDVTRAILANLKFKVLLGGLNEPESQKYFAELIGYQETLKHSTSSNAQTVTTTESENREYTIEPAELDRQGEDIALLIIPANDGYLKLKKNYYFK